ncbi:unnamed protein product [Plutella xylostella]|uniref:(diamondback moth) hypothetical protein n=1 Tax=Plutella xylostella TaxID=51655 RepID=A0A8S4DAV4_PLUXY|nr:unnamed protein product [Plutella xylostella]
MAWRLLCGSSEGCADVLHGVTTMEMLEVLEHPHAKGGSSDQAGWCGLAGSCPTLPGLLVEPTLFTLVVYWLAGLRLTAHAFGLTVLLSILVLNVAIACGAFFSCAFGSMPVAIAYLVPFDYALMMTSGIFVRLSSIPKFISWIRHLSWLMYSNEAMTILQWDGIDDIPCANTTEVRPCLSTGEEVLDRYDFESYRFWPDVFALLGLYAAFHLLALLALRFRTRRK